MKFRKYEFTPSKWAELKNEIEIVTILDEETFSNFDRNVIESVVEIGHIMITPPVLDAEMNVVTEAVLSDKYSVDILWKNDELPSFASYKIWCTPVGIHSFGASIDADYEQAYNEQLAN